MVPPINTVKHYVQTSIGVIATGVLESIPIVNAVVAPATGTSADVKEGSVVKAVYIERWLSGNLLDQTTQFTLTVEKKREQEPVMTFAQSQNLGAYPNKKNILYTTQGVVNSIQSGAPTVPVIRQFMLIPKGKQRFGLDDQLVVNIAAIVSLVRCGVATFKEYT